MPASPLTIFDAVAMLALSLGAGFILWMLSGRSAALTRELSALRRTARIPIPDAPDHADAMHPLRAFHRSWYAFFLHWFPWGIYCAGMFSYTLARDAGILTMFFLPMIAMYGVNVLTLILAARLRRAALLHRMGAVLE